MRKLILFLSDIFALYIALAATILMRYQRSDFDAQMDIHLYPFVFIFSIWLLAFYITNLYEERSLRNTLSFFSDLMRAVFIAGAVSVAFFYFIPLYGITPKTNLFVFMIVFALLQAIVRTLYNQIFAIQFKKPIIIVGTSSQALELARFIKINPQFGYKVRAVANILPETVPLEIKNEFTVIAGARGIRDVIEKERIDTVVVSPEAYQSNELIDTFYRSLDWHITFRNLASFYEETSGKVPLSAINQVWFLENLSESDKRVYEIARRFYDVILAVLMGMPFLLFLPFFALLVKFDSAGSVFYRHKRLGKSGKLFDIVKLRTMHQDAEKTTGAIWAQDNDPRVTRIGKFLRRTRIDEFPQLWNILMDEMSFVGPRAERPEFHDRLKSAIPFYEERYLVKPGLTGWAQINYRYGSSVADAAEKLQYDLYYVKHRSLLLDLGIILRTINISLRQAGK